MTNKMQKLLANGDITHGMQTLWEGALEPIMTEQIRIMVFKDKPCTPDELKGASAMYAVLEAFAIRGAEQKEKLKNKRNHD